MSRSRNAATMCATGPRTSSPKGQGAGRPARRDYVAFIWYRAKLAVPAEIGQFETAGATAMLTAYLDDYAEVWINGQMPRRAGYPSPATIQGFNIPNRVVLADKVNAGDQFWVAVFGIKSPISVARRTPSSSAKCWSSFIGNWQRIGRHSRSSKLSGLQGG
jgi:hypothetical protein